MAVIIVVAADVKCVMRGRTRCHASVARCGYAVAKSPPTSAPDRHAQNAPLGMIGQDIDRAIRPHPHVTDALAKIGQ